MNKIYPSAAAALEGVDPLLRAAVGLGPLLAVGVHVAGAAGERVLAQRIPARVELALVLGDVGRQGVHRPVGGGVGDVEEERRGAAALEGDDHTDAELGVFDGLADFVEQARHQPGIACGKYFDHVCIRSATTALKAPFGSKASTTQSMPAAMFWKL